METPIYRVKHFLVFTGNTSLSFSLLVFRTNFSFFFPIKGENMGFIINYLVFIEKTRIFTRKIILIF